jgi:hypothetical protein
MCVSIVVTFIKNNFRFVAMLIGYAIAFHQRWNALNVRRRMKEAIDHAIKLRLILIEAGATMPYAFDETPLEEPASWFFGELLHQHTVAIELATFMHQILYRLTGEIVDASSMTKTVDSDFFVVQLKNEIELILEEANRTKYIAQRIRDSSGQIFGIAFSDEPNNPESIVSSIYDKMNMVKEIYIEITRMIKETIQLYEEQRP